MKKTVDIIKCVTVKEWFTQRGEKVYLNWEFEDGKRMVRLTPYKEIPVVYYDPIPKK